MRVASVFMGTRHSLGHAIDYGEVETYMTSRRLNRECRNAIERTISQNFDGMHLKKDIVKPLAEQYGQERMALILAATLRQKAWDGRFSMDNKEWASKFPIPEHIAPMTDECAELIVGSHPAILDGFVAMFRKESRESEKEMPAARVSLKARIAEESAKATERGKELQKTPKDKQRER